MWKVININKNNIEYETEKAVLVKMPNNSKYKGYKFWHPSKLIRSGKHSNAISLSYTEDFVFKLFKNGKGQYNKKDIISAKNIDYIEFEEAFEVINDNIANPPIKDKYETYKPKKLVIENVEILVELKDE